MGTDGTTANFESENQVQFVGKSYELPSGQDVIASNAIMVKLAEGIEVSILNSLISDLQLTYLGSNPFLPQWHIFTCENLDGGGAVSASAKIYESGLVLAAEPDLMSDSRDCVNDPDFDKQYYLQNRGANGLTHNLDNNFCQARSISTGSPVVKIAIHDEGLMSGDPDWHPQYHPDVTNIYPEVYDSDKGDNEIRDYGEHGIWCAGIVGAQLNNNEGISGIAPDCPLMSISSSLRSSVLSQTKRADGINWAREHDASVINCSWHSAPNEMIADAIDLAYSMGRGGLGIVMTFSTANFNESVYFPANYDRGKVLAVGAIDGCGYRAGTVESVPQTCQPWTGRPGSNYGPELDLVAQGSYIYTTNFYNIGTPSRFEPYKYVSGTSFAAPQVAAAAALMISLNPYLTVEQISDILEKTTQKVGGYNYESTLGRPNGTWHQEVGYGLLDIHAALLESSCLLVEYRNATVTQNTQIEGCVIQSGDITVSNGANLSISAELEILIDKNFTVNPGSSALLKTEP